jgi:glucose-6-phosphate isomerase
MALRLILDAAGPLQDAVEGVRQALREARVPARIADRDHTVWKPDPTEISNRMGWMDSPAVMAPQLAALDEVVDAVRADGLTHALLLGMGGSSLAPEVFRRLFGVADGYLDVSVLDSTDPGAVAAATVGLDPARTLFIPATKSGGTVETLSFTRTCYRLAIDAVGADRAGAHFVAVTDPGSGLADLAAQLSFRHTFLNDPDIGGRYSALSFFGLLPARLGGVDVARLLDSGREGLDTGDAAAGTVLGAYLGAGSTTGRDKLTLLPSATLAPVGVWIEQLIAESTGKEGRGILPVDGEPLGPPALYGNDRLFVALRLAGEPLDPTVTALAAAGHPVAEIVLGDLHEVGALMGAWEVATIVASHTLSINPFDQPDVEAAKVLARSMMAAYRDEGRLPEPAPALQESGVTVFGDVTASTLGDAIRDFVSHPAAGAYLALQAYVPPSEGVDRALAQIRVAVRAATGLATTAGYGPRFLHSTGQLHKGDAGAGLFLQITCDDARDLPIPDGTESDDSSVSYGTLKAAQALGDRRALLDGGRRVLRLHTGADVSAGLATIRAALEAALPARG